MMTFNTSKLDHPELQGMPSLLLFFSLTAILAIASLPTSSQATPPTPPTPPSPRQQVICQEPNGTVSVRTPLPGTQLEEHCREQLTWNYDDTWLCHNTHFSFVIGLPLHKVALNTAGQKLPIQCKKIPKVSSSEQYCSAFAFVERKLCTYRDEGHWLARANQITKTARSFTHNCDPKETPTFPFFQTYLRPICLSEGCLLTSAQEQLRFFIRAFHREEISDWEFQHFFVEAAIVLPLEVTQKMKKRGIYCVSDSRRVNVEEKLLPLRYRGINPYLRSMSAASLILELPEDWPGQEILYKEEQSESVESRLPPGLSCQSDADCIMSNSGTCMVPAVAESIPKMPPERLARYPKRCRCLNGPTAYGCVIEDR